ncbi:MAG: hypothetical protein KKG47_00535 [Proteobacteria bacterium]|nr:hypothetical protein [Pseudomonadota bacterium]MBU1737225.1 hypothetical protein [Pseudomonadota bacterium]
MLKRTCIVLTAMLFALAGLNTALAYYTDTPHNESNGIRCNDCHVHPAYDNHVPGNIDDTVNNVICLGCHGPEGTAPQHTLHSDLEINGTETWTTQCIDCHDPHFQDNIRSWAGIDPDAYLATGTVVTTLATTSPEANYPAGKTTISYSGLSALPDWSDPSTWNAKGGHSDKSSAEDDSRGLILMINYENLGDTYEIIAADNSTITLKGRLPTSDGLNFAILYGQSLRSYMLDANGNGEKYIKSFSPLNSTGADRGFVDSSTSQTPFGICQVCHPRTVLYWNNDNSGNGATVHGPNAPCMVCHQHTAGFAPGADHANFLTGDANCVSCHTSFEKAEAGHPSCYSCHPVTSLFINNVTVRAESVTNHGALEASPDHSFDGADRLIDGSGRYIRDQNFTKVTCVICHVGKGANWKDHDSDTHPIAITATTDNSCETCHVSVTGPFNTVNEVHFNGGTAVASCTLCHNPADGTLISLAANHTSPSSNCKTCHGGGKHNPAPDHPSVYEGGQNNIVEPAAIQGGCSAAACHGAAPDIPARHLNRKTVTFPQGMTCQSCHTPGSKLDDATVAAAIAAGVSTAASPEPPACADCHGAQTEPHGYVDHVAPGYNGYPPIMVDAECLPCHAAYSDPGSAHITSCATCHAKAPAMRTNPDFTQFAGSATSCKDCHTLTGVSNHGNSAATVGSIHDLSSAICQSCHDNMANGLAQLNLHLGGGNSCLICHNAPNTVNGTSATNVIYRATTLILDPTDPSTPPDPSDLNVPVTCEQCHAFKGDYRLHGMTVFDTYDAHNNTVYEDSPSPEPATIKNKCTICHASFGVPNLVMGHFALSATTTYGFGMSCQSCHNYAGGKLTADIDTVIDAGVASLSTPASCADCHGVRIDTVTDRHPPTPENDHLDVAGNGYPPITPSPECTVCHNATISETHQYDCRSCHDLNLQDLAVTPYDLTQFKDSTTTCTDCHDSVAFPAIRNHGLIVGAVGARHNMYSVACLSCHDNIDDGTVQLNGHMATGDCMVCHGAPDTANGTSAMDTIAAAVAPADNLSVACEQCHEVKGDYTLHGMSGADTTDIHNNTAFDATPALTCSSTDCHSAMASVATGHLALAATTTYSTGMNCGSCHYYNPVATVEVNGLPTDVLLGTLGEDNIDAAINKGKSSAGNSLATVYCADCHGGVRSDDHPNVVHTVDGSGGYAPITPNAECTNCHNGDIVVEVHATCETCHTASMTGLITTPLNLAQFAGSTTSCTDCHSGGTVPTIRRHGITAAEVGTIHNLSSITCLACHDTMTSGLAQLNEHMVSGDCLNCHAAVDTANGTSSVAVIETATAPKPNLPVTCEQCHAVKGDYRRHGQTVANTADIHNNTVFEDSPSQEPAAIGNCATCHPSFAGPNLVVGHFAMSSTTTYGSGMNCLSCHDYTQGVLAGMTRARVDAAIAGGIAANPASCADCHTPRTDPHPTTPPNDHLGAASKGYAPITANGECVTCHSGTISQIHSYDCANCHYTIIPYLTTVPFDLTRFAGSTTTCTECHNQAVFPSIKRHGLTAASVGAKHNLSSANCLGCHRAMTTGVAQLNTHMTTGDCLKCHAAGDSGSASATAVINSAIAPANNLSVTCEGCHVVKGSYRLHGLTVADTTDAHNNTHNLATTPLTEVNNPSLDCKSCHGSFVNTDLHTVHIALTSTTTYTAGMDCLSCHNYSQGAKLPEMTQAKVDAAINAGATDQNPVECAGCHSPLVADHGGHPQPDTFVREKTECTFCHDPQSNRNYITNLHNRRAAANSLETCAVCHVNGGDALVDYSASGGVIIPNDNVNYAARTGGTGGDCLTCHNDSGDGTNTPFNQTDDFTNLITGQAAGSTFGNWTEATDVNGAAQWMIWSGASDSAGTGPANGNGEYILLESSPASAACTVDPRGTYIEAENYENTIVPGTYDWSVASNVSGANNGRYLRTTTGGTSNTPQGARTDYTVVIPADGTYQISMRLQDGDWNNTSGDSTMWGVDNTLVGIITETPVGAWTWTSNRQAGSNQVFLSAGTHTINLWPREKDQLTDAFIIWDISNAAPVSERNTSIAIPNGITVIDPTNCGGSGDLDATNGSDLLAAGTVQYLVSNTFDASLYDSLSISFSYNMNIADNDDAVLSAAAWDGTTWRSTDIHTGSTGDVWQSTGPIDFIGYADPEVYTNGDFKIRIQYRVGTGVLYQNDVAIDNIVISGDLKSVGDGSRYHPAIIHNTITDGTGYCSTTCHTEPNIITGTHKVVGGVDSPDCGKCHQSADAAVIQAIYDGSDNGAIQACVDCHSGYTGNFAASHTVIGDTHPTRVLSEAVCSTAFCHPGNVQTQVHGNTCDLCHVYVAANNGTLRGSALNHIVGTPSACSQCHIGRDSDHRGEHDNALYEDNPTQENTVAFNNVSGQCDSCHSFMGYNGTGYANISTAHVGLVIASKDLTGGENNEAAGSVMTCATCHLSANQLVVDAIANGRSSTASPDNASCADCHGVRALPHGGHDSTHFSSYGNCNSCHFETNVTAGIHANQCLLCHDNPLGGDETTIREPANGSVGDAREASKLGDWRNATCLTCHPLAANTTSIIAAHHGDTRNSYYVNEQCAACHVDVDNTVHTQPVFDNPPPVNVDPCVNCHAVFSNLSAGHIGRTVVSNDLGTPAGSEIDCMTCHGSTNTVVVNAITAGSTVPAKCAACHGPRIDPHGGHPDTDFTGSSVCISCHTIPAEGITVGFHVCADCHVGGNGAVKIGDPAGGTNGDARLGAALADYRTASCLTCHGPYMTTTTTEGAGGSTSATTYGGAHHNNAAAQAGNCDECHDDPRGGPTLAPPPNWEPTADWKNTYTVTGPATLPKKLVCSQCHTNDGNSNGLEIYEKAYQWAGVAEKSKINSIATVKTVHKLDSLSNSTIVVKNYGICLGCHNEVQKGRRINVYHARPVATNMWATGSDGKTRGTTQIDNLQKAAGIKTLNVFAEKGEYPAMKGGIGDLNDKYGKIYKEDDKLAGYVKGLRDLVGNPVPAKTTYVTIPCGSFNDWEGQCGKIGSSTSVKVPHFD